MKKMTPVEDESFVRQHVDLLRQRQFEQIERELDSSISDSDAGDTLATMAGMFPSGEPKTIKVVDVKLIRNPESSTHSLTLEYEFSDKACSGTLIESQGMEPSKVTGHLSAKGRKM